MHKSPGRFLSSNIHFFLGILIGIYVSNYVLYFEQSCEKPNGNDHFNNVLPQKENLYSKPLTLTKKEPTQNNKRQKLIRPRYYSTELGMKEKLFVGILTSEDKVNDQAVPINRTIAHLVNKIKFFITAQYKFKSKFNLTGLVGFTDTRFRYRPFQIFKYIGDNFGQEYDYYLLANDYTYLNIHRIRESVSKISVSMDVYLGTKAADSSYCNLDAGIILSNSVLKAVRDHLDWCVINAVSDSHSENIGRCIYHSIGLTCQESIQAQEIPGFKLKHFDLSKHLYDLSLKHNFNETASVYPVLQKNDFYILNAYFLQQKLTHIKNSMNALVEDLDDSWPPGQKTAAKPATRFDLPRQYYFNTTHVFFPNDFTNIKPHSKAELTDIKDVIDKVVSKATKNNKNMKYRRLLNGYKSFDLSRGMDYILDLEFYDQENGKVVSERYEACKPLSKVEFLSIPYVTENTRVNIFLPIQEHEISVAKSFLNTYVNIMNDKKDKNFIMLILIYQANSASKGKTDIFIDIKNFALKMSALYRDQDAKIAWVSIRLPSTEYVTLTQYKSLNFAVVDLALKKIGADNLVLILDPYVNITTTFLNRVRMNTIEKFQVFSPIPFRQYNPKVSLHYVLEISKNSGHFDTETYNYISFYGVDYVQARKTMKNQVPIIRVDNDISLLLKDELKNHGNLFEMFLKYSKHLHCMRATESNLIVKYHEETDRNKCNVFLGNGPQMAKMLLTRVKEFSDTSDVLTVS